MLAPYGGKYEPVLLKYVDEESSYTLYSYVQKRGYEGLKKALAMEPDAVTELVKASGLRGRGGAGFPTGMKWAFIPKKSEKPKYHVVNADESEPGTFKDRKIIERWPHSIIEGALICAWAVGIKTVYIYIRGEMPLGYQRLVGAVKEAYAGGYLGRNAAGKPGFEVDITVHRGAGAYICGEETGMLSSLEGSRGYPKLKPPFPAISGLFGCPTVVNNVTTLAYLPYILDRGVEWWRAAGTPKSTGYMPLCLSGHVRRPGLYELPLGVPMKELIYDLGGGWDRPLKAVIPGGSSSKILKLPDEIDVAVDFDALMAKGSMLGSAGIIALDDTVCIVDALLNVTRFYHHESCGQCTPCREGSGWAEKILHRIEHGTGRQEDLDVLLSLADRAIGKTICVFAEAFCWPIQSYIAKFKDEFVRHIEQRRCPMRASSTSTSTSTSTKAVAHA